MSPLIKTKLSETEMFHGNSIHSYANYDNYVTRCHAQLLKERWNYYNALISRQLKQMNPNSMFIADYGTCDGGDSLELFQTFIDFLKTTGYPCNLTILYNDLPENDFNAINKRVKSLKNNGLKVHILMNAHNMYEQCLSEGTVDIGFSTYATVFLSKAVMIDDGFGWYSANSREKELISKQAAMDWTSFLSNRYKEMKTGAYLIVRFLDPGDSIFEILELSLLDVRNQGLLTKDEVHNINIPVYIRNEEEIRAPFRDKTLRLKLVDVHFSIIPLFEDTGEAVSSCKPWIYNLLLAGLSQERNDCSKDDIIEEVINKCKDRCARISSNILKTIEVVIQKTEDQNMNNIHK